MKLTIHLYTLSWRGAQLKEAQGQIYLLPLYNRSSSVSMVTRLGGGRPGSQSGQCQEFFYSPPRGALPSSYPLGTENCFPGDKMAGA